MYILPKPHHMVEKNEKYRFSGFIGLFVHENAEKCVFLPIKQLQKALKRHLGLKTALIDRFEEGKPYILLQLSARYQSQEYALHIDAQSIRIEGGDAAGLYYGVQTLCQIIAQNVETLPCVEILDRPDYAVRGYYLDVSRGKIPKIKTLKRFIEKLAHYKINHFQLYIEHTYAFEKHPEIWAGSDPLSYDDLLFIDELCQRHHIEFVLSLNTFGHCYRVIRNRRNQHLNEFNLDAVDKPFSYRDALCHYSLDCTNPETLALIDDLIGELAPAFRSRLFNICCDETFDLGKGRNKESVKQQGVGSLYLAHLLNVIKIAEKHGKHAMCWADIILKHPELLSQLPNGVTVMHWDYSPDIRMNDFQVLAHSGIPFYVCSSVHGWRKWTHDLNVASLNIARVARAGYENGAAGFLNTDWGDAGNVNALSNSYHGMALGADCSWNAETVSGDDCSEFDKAFSMLEFADDSMRLVNALRDAARHQLVTWHDVMIWLDAADDMPAEWFDPATGFPASVLAVSSDAYVKAYQCLQEDDAILTACFEELKPFVAKHHRDDVLLGIQGARLMLEIGMIMKKIKQPDSNLPAVGAAETADRLRWFERAFSKRWHRVNRPSEYYRLKTMLMKIAEQLDKTALEGVEHV